MRAVDRPGYVELAAVLLFLVMAVALFDSLTEDAFIVYRYAVNLVDHGVLEYNLGDAIFAFTSPLHTLLVAAGYAIFGDPIAPNRALGALCFGGTVALLLRATPGSRTPVATLVLASPFAVLWAFGELETPLLTFLVTAVMLLAYPASGPAAAASPWRSVAACTLGGLAFLTRYDAVLFVAPALLGLLRRQTARSAALGLTVGALAPLAWLSFAHYYYGDVFPTSFYYKTPRLGIEWTLGNAVYMLEFYLYSGIPLYLIAVALLLRRRADAGAVWKAHWARLRWAYLGLGLVATYGLGAANTHMFYSFRLFVPYLPVAALAVADLSARALPMEPSGRNGRPLTVAAACVVLLQAVNFAQIWRPGGNIGGGHHGEFGSTGVREMNELVGFLGAPAEAIRSHWSERVASRERPPRVFTYAGGLLPWKLRDAYVYEPLTAYRHRCKPSHNQLRRMADYFLVTRYVGIEVPERFPSPERHIVKIFDDPGALDGRAARHLVYFNGRPALHALPRRIAGRCRYGQSPQSARGAGKTGLAVGEPVREERDAP